jgi:hypothetical protein
MEPSCSCWRFERIVPVSAAVVEIHSSAVKSLVTLAASPPRTAPFPAGSVSQIVDFSKRTSQIFFSISAFSIPLAPARASSSHRTAHRAIWPLGSPDPYG